MTRLFRSIFLAVIICTLPASAVQTSHWTHTNEADFKKGTFHNVVATNFGDLKLSRAVKTILEQDAKVSAIYSMVEAADGSIYAGTGPNGVLLRVKEDKVTTIATFENNTNLYAVLVDAKGRLLVGISGEKGRVVRLDKPEADAKPVEVFAEEGVQYVWGLEQTPDGNIYVATGPTGKLFEITPDGKKSVMLASDETNLLSLLSDGKETLYVGTDPSGLVYRINRKTKDVFVLFDAPESEISCLALDKSGNLYAGTAEAAERPGIPGAPGAAPAAGEKAGRPEGTGGVPLPSPTPPNPKPPVLPDPNPGEPNPIPTRSGSLSLGAPGAVARVRGSSSFRDAAEEQTPSPLPSPPEYRGRGSEPLLYRSFFSILADAPEPPPAPAPGIPGAEKKPGAPATAPVTSVPTPPLEPDQAAQPKAEGNAIYKIDRDGFVTEIFRQPALVLSMVEHEGTLLVGTGSEGFIYQLDPKAQETLVLAKVEPKQVLCLLPAKDGRILLGLANVGGLAAMSSGFAADGTFISPVLDATQISRFGKIHLQGSLPAGSSLTVATRSGNVQDPEKTGWSKWSDEASAVAYLQVPSPSARFLQYRVSFASAEGKVSPVVDQVDVAYQVPNQAPVIKSVKIGSASAAIPPITVPGLKPMPVEPPATPSPETNRVQTVTWEGEDANGDTLTYSLFFRSGPRTAWILLKDKLADAHYDWDTRLVADGRYEIKVVASDAGANPPGEGKTGTRVSEPFLVDNTPPAIGDLKSSVKGRAVKIDARIVDRTSTVASFAYSVDSNNDWQAVLPSDSIFDSPEETVSFTVKGLLAGAHQIMLRATDAKGNQSFENVTITIPPPAKR